MAAPNPNARLKVLVCDNGNPGRYSSPEYVAANAVDRVIGSRVEITRVDDFDSAIREIRTKNSPYYSLFVIAAHHINDSKGGFKLKAIRDFNPYLPEVIYGKDITRRNLAKGMRRGVRYYAENDEDLHKDTKAIFYVPSHIKGLVVVKFGGSSFDFDRKYKESSNLPNAAQAVIDVSKRIPTKKLDPRQRIIGTVGAGQLGEVIKDFAKSHPESGEKFGRLIADALDLNLAKLACLMPHGSYNLYRSEDFYFINFNNTTKPALMSVAPHYILARDGIPLQDSDTHTIAIAELYGAKRVVLIKRTDGIYDFDPNIGGFTKDIGRWKGVQKNNSRHSVLRVEDLLNGNISREGTDAQGVRDGSLGHLMEDSALEYFAKCNTVEEILVVHIAPEEMYISLGNNEFEHAVVPEDKIIVDPVSGWKGVLEQRINDAFKGIANSKIVRG